MATFAPWRSIPFTRPKPKTQKPMKPKHHWQALACTLALGGIAHAEITEKYVYDASGNITEKTVNGVVTRMTYDSANRLMTVDSAKGKESYRYDASGRPEAIQDASGKTTRAMANGYADKVLEANNSGTKAKFYYNAEGQLVGKTVNGKSVAYSWDGNVLATEGEEVFTNEAHMSGGVPLLRGSQQVVTSDYLGNTLAHGKQSFTASAFGEGLEGGRFTGKTFIQELDGFAFLHRIYSVKSNHWTTSDPSGFPDALNNCSYLSGNPLTSLDPNGLVEYIWDPTATYAGHGVFYPKSITVDTTGTIKTVEIDKGNGNKCYQPVVDKAYKFKGGGQIQLPAVGWVDSNGYTCDATYVSTATIHETWHKTHRQTLGDKTYGVLETWTAEYAGMEFGSASEAKSKGIEDFNTAKAKTATKYAAYTDKSFNHDGASPLAIYYPAIIDGHYVNRTQNPDWGNPLNNILNQISLNFDKVDGTCEY
ncbi:MAG: RHS repeat-associated core domain-containing protein [Luteolibacter sp.]